MQLHFKQLGRGRPVVMLHGLFGSLDNWLGVAPRLAETFTLYLVDQRNHGLSPHDSEMNYSVMADDVAEFFGDRKLDRAHVVGHSMGAKAAMQFALRYSARVEKLVAVDMTPRASALDHENIFKALEALDLGRFASRGQIEDALGPALPDLVIRRFLLKNLKTVSSPSFHFEWKIPLDILHRTYPNICQAIPPRAPFPGPALFLRGGKSHYVPENSMPEIRALFPNARLETVAQAGHWVQTEAPEEFIRRVSAFLKE